MPLWPPRGVTGPSTSLSGAFSPESKVITNWPSGIFMLLGHLDSAALAKAIASFSSFMPAINIGARPGASVENGNVAPEFDHAAPPRRLARPSARRADAAGLRRAYGAP